MTTSTQVHIAALMPEFFDTLTAVWDSIPDMKLCLVSSLRNAQQQNELYAQGRTAPGHIVTNASYGLSMHNYGLAVDVVPYLTGSNSTLNWKSQTPQFQAMVKAFKDAGLAWGGDWKGNLGDFDHFQIGSLPPTPTKQMQVDLSKGLEYVWQQVRAGVYVPAGQ